MSSTILICWLVVWPDLKRGSEMGTKQALVSSDRSIHSRMTSKSIGHLSTYGNTLHPSESLSCSCRWSRSQRLIHFYKWVWYWFLAWLGISTIMFLLFFLSFVVVSRFYSQILGSSFLQIAGDPSDVNLHLQTIGSPKLVTYHPNHSIYLSPILWKLLKSFRFMDWLPLVIYSRRNDIS